jgi:hypothetical protein
MAEETPKEEPAAAPEAKAEEKPAEKPAEQPAPEAKPAPAPAAAPAAGAQPAGEKKSSAPFILSLIGGILILITGIILAALATLITAILGSMAIPGTEGIFTAGMMLYVPLLLGIVVMVGAVLMRNPAKAKIGGILVLICSIVSLLTIVGSGFFIGAILGIIGGALGLKG